MSDGRLHPGCGGQRKRLTAATRVKIKSKKSKDRWMLFLSLSCMRHRKSEKHQNKVKLPLEKKNIKVLSNIVMLSVGRAENLTATLIFLHLCS